jgi:hypothetical protein
MLKSVDVVEAPLVEVKLPSLGIPYGIKDSVNLRMMRTTEEKYFSSMVNMAKSTSIVSLLIKACSDIEIDPIKLLIDDRFYLLFKLRSITYTPEYKIEYVCASCDKKFIHVFNIDDAEVTYLDPAKLFIEVDLPIRGSKVILKRATGEDEDAVADYEKKVVKVKEHIKSKVAKPEFDVEGDPLYYYRLARSIHKIDGEEYDMRTKLEFVGGKETTGAGALYGKDSLTLRNALDNNSLGFSLELNTECNHCGYQDIRLLQSTVEFFRPRL